MISYPYLFRFFVLIVTILGTLEIKAERGKTAEKYLEDMKEGMQVSSFTAFSNTVSVPKNISG